MNWKSVFTAVPVAAVVVIGAAALRPAPAFSQSASCGTLSCSAEFTPCISQSYCNNGCDNPDQCQCNEYGTPVWYTSECAPNESDTACFCPIGPGDGTGGGAGKQGCDGTWEYYGGAC